MPSSPKFLYAFCQERISEVIHKPESKHPGTALGNIRVSAKIAVYLECEQNGRYYKIQSAVAVG